MKRSFANYIAISAAMAVGIFLASMFAAAQDKGAPAGAKDNKPKVQDSQLYIDTISQSGKFNPAAHDAELAAKPTPRLADGHPDLSGVWGGPGGGDRDAIGPDGSIVLSGGGAGGAPLSEDPENKHAFSDYHGIGHDRRMSAPNQPPYKPELQAKVKDLDYNANFKDPAFFCKPPGVPRAGTPDQVFARPGAVVFLYAPLSGNFFREIPTDGRAHDKLNTDTYNGDSVGHWEGDTLVVDSTNFNDDTWFSADGQFHSTQLHVVERFTRQGDLIHYEVTVEDPGVFTRPWVMNPRVMRPYNHKQVASTDVLEETAPCIEREEAHIKAVDGHEH